MDPNTMTCTTDIATYNKIRSEQMLFQFLNAIYQQHGLIKREILRWAPLPSDEEVYVVVRKKTAHQNILMTVSGSSSQGVAVELITEATWPSSRGRKRSDSNGKPHSSSLRSDKSRLWCSHCGMSKHTKEQCFKIVGYPEWWSDGHKRNIRPGEENGNPSVVVGNTEVTSTGGGNQQETRKDAFIWASVVSITATSSIRRLQMEGGTKQTKGRNKNGCSKNN